MIVINIEKKKYYFNNKCLFIMVIIATLFMGIGYASINSLTLSVIGSSVALANEELFIASCVPNNSFDVNGEVISISGTLLNLKTTLGESDSSVITYSVSICNGTSNSYIYSGIVTDDEGLFYDNTGIEFTTSLQKGTIIESGKCVDFDLSFNYVDDYYGSSDFSSVLNSYLKFDFNRVYNVTYENLGDDSNYPKYVYGGNTFSLTLDGVLGPIEVKQGENVLDSGGYTFDNYVLTIPNVSGDLHIRDTRHVLVNLVKNGSFENGLADWELVGDAGTWLSTPIALYGSTAYYRVPSARFENYLSQNITWYEGHVYYYFAYSICTSEQKFVSDIYLKNALFGITSVPTAYGKGSLLYTADFTGDNTISINFDTITDNVIVDGIGIVDLTEAFGSGYEPDLTWCNANINYFDGELIVYK